MEVEGTPRYVIPLREQLRESDVEDALRSVQEQAYTGNASRTGEDVYLGSKHACVGSKLYNIPRVPIRQIDGGEVVELQSKVSIDVTRPMIVLFLVLFLPNYTERTKRCCKEIW